MYVPFSSPPFSVSGVGGKLIRRVGDQDESATKGLVGIGTSDIAGADNKTGERDRREQPETVTSWYRPTIPRVCTSFISKSTTIISAMLMSGGGWM